MSHLDQNTQKIINTISPWKIVAARDLFRMLGKNTNYSGFWRKLKRMEKDGLLKCHSTTKTAPIFISLTRTGLANSNEEVKKIMVEGDLNHDLLLTKIMNSLVFDNAIYDLQYGVHDLVLRVEPDAVAKMKKGEVEFSIAVELEITQKEKSRIFLKWGAYLKSDYDLFIYFFPHESTMRSYESFLDEYLELLDDKEGSDLRDAIVFVYVPSNFKTHGVLGFPCSYQGELSLMSSLLLDEKVRSKK